MTTLIFVIIEHPNGLERRNSIILYIILYKVVDDWLIMIINSDGKIWCGDIDNRESMDYFWNWT